MLLDPVWRSVASKLGSHSCHCFGMSWAIFMLDRKTYDGKSQLLYRFRASALCEYYRLPSYSKHYLSGQFLHKTTFLMLLGWKYSHAFIQSHVADKTSPYWRLLSLLAQFASSLPAYPLLPETFVFCLASSLLYRGEHVSLMVLPSLAPTLKN